MRFTEKLERIVKPICEAENLHLVEIKIRGDAKKPVFEIYADSEKGINLGQCEKLSRLIQDELDMDEQFLNNYRLDVSSPGLDRALEYDWEFKKNIGHNLEITLDTAEQITGRLLSFDENELIIEDEKNQQQAVARSSVKQVKVKIQW